jgi:hypothetical protein
MIRNHFKRGKYEYEKYRCGSRWRPFKTECRGQGVTINSIHEWIWSEIKTILLDPSIIERALNEVEQSGPDPQLTTDLQAAKKAREQTERGLKALVSRFRSSADNATLWPYIEREIKQASLERQQLESAITELEARINVAHQRVADLRYLNDYCSLVRENLAQFTFDDQLLALRALGVKVFANGDEPTGWRYEVSIPIKETENIKVLRVSSSARL